MSSHKNIVSGLSGRYALALYELAEKNDSIEAIEKELAQLVQLLKENAEFAEIVQSPVFSKSEQVRACVEVSKIIGSSKVVGNFLAVLATNRRLKDLKSITAGYNKLAAFKRGEVSAEVISAQKLTSAQEKTLKASLKKAVGKDVTFESKVDESLLGGMIVKLGSRMIDSSLKSKLENLKVSMKGV